ADDLDRQVFGLREGSRVTLALLDLDGFKSYNDRFGHLAGDALLARFGARLCDALGRSGEAYRFGGDEFCVIVRASSSEHHDAVVTRAREALREVGDGFDVSASCGVVEAPGDGREPLELLQLADSRLYADKSLRGERAAA
ncbi:MAG: GGDEF domain-containing protein, partial [Thermoleophilaceae bacterium]